jgi:hypothetical protein
MSGKYPWNGAAKPMTSGAFGKAAKEIGCEVAAIKAIWAVEAASRGFLRDRSLIRRFEPHHMPGSKMGWRESLKIGPKRREEMMVAAFGRSPEYACRASSWGGPQIMGFNAEEAGHETATEMVEEMADDEDKHLSSFVTLVLAWGLAGAIRSHNWLAFAKRYNGSGQPEVYAQRIEAAYQQLSGKASPVVLRIGDRGPAVKRLQSALGIEVDGAFGPGTDKAVRAFQASTIPPLPVDGIVGARTWEVLEEKRMAIPKVQATPADVVAGEIGKWGAVLGGAGATAGAVREFLPPLAFDLLGYGAVGLVLVAVAAFGYRKLRGV